jgi:Family of unknown function (DUF5995)
LAVATNAPGERQDRPDRGSSGLDAVLRALRAQCRRGCAAPGATLCCTWVCWAVVGEVRGRGLVPGPDDEASALVDLPEPDAEFEAVLVRRFADRYLRVVADRAEGRPVPRVWQLLLDPPPARPARLALAGVAALLAYDLTLAFVGTCTVLGRAPGRRERDAHHRIAALLGTCVRELVRRSGDAADMAAAAQVDSPAARDAAWNRAQHLWTLRGRPAEAEEERVALDREVRADALRTLGGDA